MSFFAKLFGRGKAEPKKTAAEPVSHEGYEIIADPKAEGQQFRLSGLVTREIDGERKEHLLIRADLFSSRDEACEATIRKAKQVIKEQGDGIFS